MYRVGSTIATKIGLPLIGGVYWDISVLYASFLMFPLAFLMMYVFQKYKKYYLLITLSFFLLFILLTNIFIGGQFSGSHGVHPYRYVYFQICSLMIFLTLLSVQLTRR